MNARLKAVWESLRNAVRPGRVRTLKIPDGDPGALLCAAHWTDRSTVLRLCLPPRLLVMEGGFTYTTASHHFLAAIEHGRHTLAEFYQRFQPQNIAAMYAVSGGRCGSDLPPWEIPWIGKARSRAPRGEGGLGPEHGTAIYGPATDKKVDLEMQRLTGTYESIRSHGYQPDRHGDITGFLLRRGQEFRFLVRGGKHRTAALVHLGHPLVPVQFKPHWPRIIDRADVAHWPLVREGRMDEALAQDIFDCHFGLTLEQRYSGIL